MAEHVQQSQIMFFKSQPIPILHENTRKRSFTRRIDNICGHTKVSMECHLELETLHVNLPNRVTMNLCKWCETELNRLERKFEMH